MTDATATEADARERTPDDVLAELTAVAAQLTLHNAILTDLYAQRDRLYCEARAFTPPVTQKRMAAAAGMSEVAVVASLRKLRERGLTK